MNLPTAELAMLVLVIALVGVIVGLMWDRKDQAVLHKIIEQTKDARLQQKSKDLAERLGVRFEIVLSDWYDDGYDDEMRWRWTIWDADREFKRAFLGIDEDEVPLMLGNAPTRSAAEAEAMAWLATRHPEAPVVIS